MAPKLNLHSFTSQNNINTTRVCSCRHFLFRLPCDDSLTLQRGRWRRWATAVRACVRDEVRVRRSDGCLRPHCRCEIESTLERLRKLERELYSKEKELEERERRLRLWEERLMERSNMPPSPTSLLLERTSMSPVSAATPPPDKVLFFHCFRTNSLTSSDPFVPLLRSSSRPCPLAPRAPSSAPTLRSPTVPG